MSSPIHSPRRSPRSDVTACSMVREVSAVPGSALPIHRGLRLIPVSWSRALASPTELCFLGASGSPSVSPGLPIPAQRRRWVLVAPHQDRDAAVGQGLLGQPATRCRPYPPTAPGPHQRITELLFAALDPGRGMARGRSAAVHTSRSREPGGGQRAASSPPGTARTYTDTGFVLAGLIIESLARRPLHEA